MRIAIALVSVVVILVSVANADSNLLDQFDRNYTSKYNLYDARFDKEKGQIRDFYINDLKKVEGSVRSPIFRAGTILVLNVYDIEKLPDGSPKLNRNGDPQRSELKVISLMIKAATPAPDVSSEIRNGTWRYFFLAPNFDDKTTLSDRLDCHGCHTKQKSTDFVFSVKDIYELK